jgi:beta-N-acetylhexosaminidase
MLSLGMAMLAAAFGGLPAAPATDYGAVAPPLTAPYSRPATVSTLTNAQAVGQTIIATYAGTQPPQSLLSAVRQGHVGSVILMGGNTDDSVSVTHAATVKLQAAARAGHNSGLLIMTDQEGGEVKRLPGAPAYAAAQMSNATLAGSQGYATAKLLKQAGVNVDLAPVADVTRVDGFMTQEHRTFGSKPAVVAKAACAFAAGLKRGGIAYTLKHFPGLGDAIDSTDTQPVAINESAANIYADDAAYRQCGQGPTTLVMVSSASYSHLTGKLPAVLSPTIYKTVMPQDHISAVTVSDALQTGAIKPWKNPERLAIAAGLDMVMYAHTESGALNAYTNLVDAVNDGAVKASRVQQAAAAVLKLKHNLGLG